MNFGVKKYEMCSYSIKYIIGSILFYFSYVNLVFIVIW